MLAQTGLMLDPPELLLSEGDSLFAKGTTLSLTNGLDERAELVLFPGKPELKADPASLTLEPGDSAEIRLSYVGETPGVNEMFMPLVIMNRVDRSRLTYLIYHPEAYSPVDDTLRSDRGGDHDVLLTYYYSPSCKSCRAFLEKEIPRLERELAISIGLELRDIFDQENMDLLKKRLEGAGLKTDSLPVLDTGEVVLAGEERITGMLETVLRGEDAPPDPSSVGEGRGEAPLWLLVAGAGLLDGINPCAFSTLIFLLAYLGLRKRDRGEILTVGILFTLTVFLTYTAVGAGAFVLLRESMGFPILSSLLKWGGAGALTVLAGLSFRDYLRLRRGDGGDMTLQLSPGVKRAVHKSVREGVRSALPALGAAAMGFTVTIYELGCTGQIYLPTLYLMTRRGEGRGYWLLLLYNLAFILPLAVVFFLAWRGLASEKLSAWFRNRLGAVKLATAGFFLAAAVVMTLI